MKINGIEVKGLKRAVSEYNNSYGCVIIFDHATNTLQCVTMTYANNVWNECDEYGHFKYAVINFSLVDRYNSNKVTMSRVKSILSDYILWGDNNDL